MNLRDNGWKHYIAVNYPDKLVSLHPKPHCRFELRTDRSTHLPLVVFEYQSGSEQDIHDHYRLLAQCMVYVRLAEMLGVRVDFNGHSRTVVLACYVDKQYVATVYLLTTVDREVRIYQLVS